MLGNDGKTYPRCCMVLEDVPTKSIKTRETIGKSWEKRWNMTIEIVHGKALNMAIEFALPIEN